MLRPSPTRRALAALPLLALLPSAGRAAPAGAIDQLRAFLSQTRAASGEFTQRVAGGKGAVPQVSSGRFVFQRPGRFRWVYEKPYEQVLVADGERLYLYDKDLNQVTVKRIAAALPASPAAILFGTDDFEREFTVTELGERDGLAWLEARPRAKESQFERIAIGFRDGLPAALELADGFGQTTQLQLARVQRNPKVDAQTFRFTPPPGAEVLQER
ncbi:MAG: outer membrane lipoprotein chaperone LolA [Burkholderiaceae bacterium]|nr:outer membrane lipoprotein chaperone LolA [Burkholderiaceae bacterium]